MVTGPRKGNDISDEGPDPRLIELVKFLARRAAAYDVALELEVSGASGSERTTE